MSYFSNILTATKSRYESFRASDEADGETEDDSHLSRVLRAYYAEKGSPYPDWLGPPPNQRSQSPATSLRNTYGRRQNPPQASQAGSSASLSDIWDAPPPSQHPQQGGAGTGGRPNFGRQAPVSRPALFPDEPSSASSASASSGISAQQRIKERLWGSSRSAAASPTATSPLPHQQQHSIPPHNGRPEMQAPSSGVRRERSPMRGGAEKPYVGAGMPWDNSSGEIYSAPAVGRGGGGGRPIGGWQQEGGSYRR